MIIITLFCFLLSDRRSACDVGIGSSPETMENGAIASTQMASSTNGSDGKYLLEFFFMYHVSLKKKKRYL